MKPFHTVTVSARIPSPAADVYSIIADYRTGHPRILPPQFSNMTVETGGIGAGTIVAVDLTLMGRTQHFRAAVTEPEPGRILIERNNDGNDGITTFTVEPTQTGECEVTIQTVMPVHTWIAPIERFLSTRLLEPLYREELQKPAAVASSGV